MAIEDRGVALWSAVVLQSRDDVASLPIGSMDYASAVAFLTDTSAYWRAAREDVAAHLNLHPDDLRKAGISWVLERRRGEGLPDHPEPPAPLPVPVREPLVIPADLRATLCARHRPAAGGHRVRA